MKRIRLSRIFREAACLLEPKDPEYPVFAVNPYWYTCCVVQKASSSISSSLAFSVVEIYREMGPEDKTENLFCSWFHGPASQEDRFFHLLSCAEAVGDRVIKVPVRKLNKHA